MSQITICIGNYGAYNEGYLIDRWVDLPLSTNQLNAILKEMRKQAEALTGCPCEEFYVSDYDGIPFGYAYGHVFSELTPIHHLNLLAHVMQEHPEATQCVQDVLDTGIEAPDSVLGIAQWILHNEDIPYYSYDCPEHCDNPAEKIGYTYLMCEPWFNAMAHDGADIFFDVEGYGNMLAANLYLGENGYVDPCGEFPDEHQGNYYELYHTIAAQVPSYQV